MMSVQLERGKSRTEAACAAFRETAKPMLTGTLVTCAGFIPVAFSKGAAAEFCKALFPVITASLLLSWIVSVMVAPLFGYYLIKVKENGPERDLYDNRFYRLFRRVLYAFLTHKRRCWQALPGCSSFLRAYCNWCRRNFSRRHCGRKLLSK